MGFKIPIFMNNVGRPASHQYKFLLRYLKKRTNNVYKYQSSILYSLLLFKN